MTLTVVWCAVKVIDIIGAAISHFNVGGKTTTA